MKKIFAAVVVLTGGLAFAQVDATEVGPGIKKEAKDIGKTAKENVKDLGAQAGMATESQGTFKQDKAFTLNGTLEKAGSEELTVARQGLPPAVLDVRNETKVMLDGKKAKASDLKEGAEIKAHFQLEGEETVAVHIDAKSKAQRGTGGSAEAGQKTDEKLNRAANKAEKDAHKAEKKADKLEDKAAHESEEIKDDMNR